MTNSVCIYVCMYIGILMYVYICIHTIYSVKCMFERMYCTYEKYVCMYVCMYGMYGMYVCMYTRPL